MRNERSFMRWLSVVFPAALALAWATAVLAAPPALISLSPVSATAGGAAFTLTINGTDFTSASTSVWDGVALATTYKNSTQLEAAIPASLIENPGTATVTVKTPGVVSTVPIAGSATLTIDSQPAISGSGPASAVLGSALPPSMSDAKFTLTSTWDATALTTHKSAAQLAPVTPVSLVATSTSGASTEDALTVSPSSPAVTAPAAAGNAATQPTAAVNTSLVNTIGGAFPGSALDINPPLPTISSLSPNLVLAGGLALTLVVNGSNYISGSGATVVFWNSTALTTTYVNSTELMAAVPASLIASPGSASITVVTGSGTSSGLPITISPAQPVITSLSPSRVTTGSGAFAMNVYGTNFTSAAIVNWGTTPLVTTHTEGGSLTAQVPASLVATTGTVSVTVTTDEGTSAPATFDIAPPSPVIASLSPGSAAAGGAAFTLTINGTNFVQDMEILWGSTWVASIYVSATQVTTTIPASLIATAGAAGVVIYAPGIGWSNTSYFTINPAPPSITSLGPASATAGGAGFMLTIQGTAFTPGAASMWGATPLGTIYVSPTQLTAAVPASLIVNSGTGSVTVTTAAGTSGPATFTINPAPPVISGLSSIWATAGGAAFTLTIYGANFTSAAAANWGSTALATTYISPTELMAAIPSSLIATAGTAGVTVSTAAGTSAPITITINPALKLTTTALPAGTAGNAYSGLINVTGGVPGYSWTVTGLPNSFSYFNTSDSTLTITGTPASSGVITIQVWVQDTTGASAGPVAYTINVAAGPSGVNDINLDGRYVCLFQGLIDTDGTRWATVASFQADGQGNFLSGIFDTNSYDIGSASGAMTGSYSIGSDNNGMASIRTVLTNGAAGIQTTHWAMALSGAAQPAQQFRMVEADDLGTLPSYQQGSANCYLATSSAFASNTISGSSFAFGLDGEDNSGNLKASAGIFSASGGNSASGNIDSALGGNATVQSSAFTATYTAPDPATGRFTMALKGAGNSTGFSVYIIDANRMFILDNTSNDGEQAGNMRAQQQASYSGVSVNGPFVLYMRGAEFNSGGSTPSGYYAHIFQGAGDGAGNMAINQSCTDDDGVYSAGQSNGGPFALTFDSAHPGRATFLSANGTTYLYLFNTGSAFEMSVGDNGALDSGWLESQTQTSFTYAALAGNYILGELPLLSGELPGSVGEYTLTGSGAINGAITTSGRGELSWDQAMSMIYSWDTTAPATGTFLIANGSKSDASCAAISATKFVCTSQTDPAPSVEVIEQ
jgi:hypothetical protein